LTRRTGTTTTGLNSKTLSPAAVVANGSVTTVKIVDEAVTADKIAANAVTTAKLADGAVTGAKIPAQNITTAHLADENVTAPKVADGAVTADKIGVRCSHRKWRSTPMLLATVSALNAETNAIEVKVDDATIEISSDTLQVKASGVDTTQPGRRRGHQRQAREHPPGGR